MGDVKVSDITAVTNSTPTSWGGPVGAWSAGGVQNVVARSGGGSIRTEFSLTFSGLQRGLLHSCTLQFNILAFGLLNTFYLGLVDVATAPDFNASATIDRTGFRTQINGVYYPTEFRAYSLGSLGTVTFDLMPFAALQRIFYRPTWDGILRIVATSSMTQDEATFTATNEGLGPAFASVLDLNLTVPSQNDDNTLSVADERYHERWFTCPRCGMHFPVSRSVLDGERKGLIVCDTGCADLRGRKTNPTPTQEREDRLWPRL